MSVTHNMPDHAVVAAHVISIGAIFGTFAGMLPPLAALAAIIWYAIQIYESDTFRAWLNRRQHRTINRDPTGNIPDPGTPSGPAKGRGSEPECLPGPTE